jgi:cytochrome P450
LSRWSPATTEGPAGIDFALPAIARDPFPHYESLRRHGSVHFLLRHDAWIVLGYDDVQAAFKQPGVFSNRPYTDLDAVLAGADPPSHAPVRRLVSQCFSGEALDQLTAFSAARAAALLSPRMDLVASFSRPLAEAMADQLLGWSDGALETIRDLTARNLDTVGMVRALDEIAPQADTYRRLLGDGLADEQARSLVRLLWLAAATTTGRGIASCALHLLTDAAVADALRRDGSLVPAFVEEVLRLHPPELMVPRETTATATLAGRQIPAGSLVYLCLGAANRDPAKFERPEALWLARPPVRHLAFGYGIHHCVGATLGRRTIETAVRAVLAYAPSVRATEPLESVVTWCSMTASPVGRLQVEFAP